MDSVASFEMAAALAEHGVMTAVLPAHYTVEQWAEFAKTADKKTLNNVFVSTWSLLKLSSRKLEIMALSEEFVFICIDIANGYSEHLVEFSTKSTC